MIKKDAQRLQTFANKCALGAPGTRKKRMHDEQKSMTDVFKELHLDMIFVQINQRQRRWLGHIARLPTERWEQKCLIGALAPEWTFKRKAGGQNLSMHRTFCAHVETMMMQTAVQKDERP